MSDYEEFDTWHTQEVICPHCGHEHSDSWEFQDSCTTECHSCDKLFIMERNIEITYSTSKQA
jgi:hypothetical protein